MWLLGIVGIVVSTIARKRENSGIATAGLVLSIIGTILSLISFFFFSVCAAGIAGASLFNL
jgi:hypothetical protein